VGQDEFSTVEIEAPVDVAVIIEAHTVYSFIHLNIF
jgi:hypothetical protein